MSYAVGDRVLVNSALAFAIVVDVEETRTGPRYTVKFPDGYTCLRYASELTTQASR